MSYLSNSGYGLNNINNVSYSFMSGSSSANNHSGFGLYPKTHIPDLDFACLNFQEKDFKQQKNTKSQTNLEYYE
ncbi:unnamed protein product [Brachionus calyciflorus]|uniref:Uncharacterized protein n=1 Tax=Brachionus calyciflorus TaxID=104777 RepID=A0A813ZGU6_9BILA|nr:unnamed protein product [Brachionus calyciflorus]